MKNYTKLDLLTQELNRIRKLRKISDTFMLRHHREKYPLFLAIMQDWRTAFDENSKAWNEVTMGIVPESHEIHFKRCLESGVPECTCLMKICYREDLVAF